MSLEEINALLVNFLFKELKKKIIYFVLNVSLNFALSVNKLLDIKITIASQNFYLKK